jgi:hypothetical protein
LRLEVVSWRLEAGDWKLEVGSWRLEAGDWKHSGWKSNTMIESRNAEAVK